MYIPQVPVLVYIPQVPVFVYIPQVPVFVYINIVIDVTSRVAVLARNAIIDQ